MDIDRRYLLAGTAGLGAAVAMTQRANASGGLSLARSLVIQPNGSSDDTAHLQTTIDRAAAVNLPVEFSPGEFNVLGPIYLRSNTKLIGPHGLATLNLIGNGAINADNSAGIAIVGLTINGAASAPAGDDVALVNLNDCANAHLTDIVVIAAPANGIQLSRTSGRIERNRFEHVGHTAIFSSNAFGLDISHNRIAHAGNNGIAVWRETVGDDGTTITHNHIAHIRADSGGSGQNGNAINAFRAGRVLMANNTISQCAYSAVRCNAASNAQIIANSCRSIGEVALYAEFAFEGAVIASNIVDGAATGISVTNFKEGGRLATVQGNLVRNLFRREHEPVDKRGVGIAVEADTVVNGNTIEEAATAGIAIGWGKWMRNVTATGNIIRSAPVGVTVSAHGKPQSVLLSGNIISGTRKGGVRLADHNQIVGRPLRDGTVAGSPVTLAGNILS